MVKALYLNVKGTKQQMRKLDMIYMICILFFLSGCISAPSFNYYLLDNSFKPKINEKSIMPQVSSIRLLNL